MGCTYEAHTVLGLRIDWTALKETYIAKNTRQARGCEHDVPEGQKFCGICGAPREVEVVPEFYFDAFKELIEEKNPGISVVQDGSERGGYVYIGFGNSAGEYHGSSSKFDMPTQGQVESLKAACREFFIPYGAWDPRNFGVWTFLYVGC